MSVQPIIVSHKRAGQVTTHKFIAGCTVCVPESQADDYERLHPDLPRLVHPDSVVGLWAKRQWIKERVGDHMQFDDDGIGIYRIYRSLGGWRKSVMSPDRAYDLIQRTGERCRAFGAYFFGFAPHAHPMTYDGLKPFRFGGYIAGGNLGFLEGCKVWWPTDVSFGDGCDQWACLLNAYYHRYSFSDRRFAFAARQTYIGGGGLNEFRAGRVEQEQLAVLAYLQEHFGHRVIVRNYDEPDGIATKYLYNPVRRRIITPYRV